MTTKKENTVRFTLEELQQMIHEGSTGTDWERIDRMTREEINRNALEDLDEHGIPHDWWKDATRASTHLLPYITHYRRTSEQYAKVIDFPEQPEERSGTESFFFLVQKVFVEFKSVNIAPRELRFSAISEPQ